jgi:hypothetical protein
MTMRLWIVALAGALAAPLPAQTPPEGQTPPAEQAPPGFRQSAQETEAPATEQEPAGEEPGPLDLANDALEPTLPGGYSYRPQGRRDPFVSLNRPVAAGDEFGRPAGIEGFLIQELTLTGIVKLQDEGFVSMFQGPDNKSYFVRLGQRVYDGEVVALDMDSVTFRQEVADPLSTVRTRELVKSLYPSEEAR